MSNVKTKIQKKEKRILTQDETIIVAFTSIRNAQSSIYGFKEGTNSLSVEGIYEKVRSSEAFRGMEYPEVEAFLAEIGQLKNLRPVMMKVKIAEVLNQNNLLPERGGVNFGLLGRNGVTEYVAQFLHFKRGVSADQIGLLLNESQLKILNWIDKIKQGEVKRQLLMKNSRQNGGAIYNENIPIPKETQIEMKRLLIEGKSHLTIAKQLNVSRASVALMSGRMHDMEMAEIMRNKKKNASVVPHYEI